MDERKIKLASTAALGWGFAVKRTRRAQLRSKVGRWLRRLADRIDRRSPPQWADITDHTRSVGVELDVADRLTLTLSNRDRLYDPYTIGAGMTVYPESPADRDERHRRGAEEAATKIRITPGQSRWLRDAH